MTAVRVNVGVVHHSKQVAVRFALGLGGLAAGLLYLFIAFSLLSYASDEWHNLVTEGLASDYGLRYLLGMLWFAGIAFLGFAVTAWVYRYRLWRGDSTTAAFGWSLAVLAVFDVIALYYVLVVTFASLM